MLPREPSLVYSYQTYSHSRFSVGLKPRLAGFSDQLCQKGRFLTQAKYPSIRGKLSLSTNL